MKYIVIYLIVVNSIAFLIFGVDKNRAKRGSWRIPESTLISIAVIGGSLGAYLGMKAFHHKTKHMKFAVGVPAIFFVHAFLWMCYQYLG
ncbi:MAG: DUF1294 domain-containing protein [Lachnospiraceae bacterium]|nr:DUF1294 domain-containing protein [Lachnospiraceae bacterium]